MGHDSNTCTFGAFATLIGILSLPAAATAQDQSEATWADTLSVEVSAPFYAPEYRSFDFWAGEWDVNWRNRKPENFYHDDLGSWTHNRVFPILGGKALMELAWDRDKPETPSQRGLSVRYFSPEYSRWFMAQLWPSAAGSGYGMLDQLVGRERHGRLSMYSIQRGSGPNGEKTEEHRRYNFTDIRPGVSLRWDGSNTKDRGATWTTWAIAEMHRTGDLNPFKTAGSPFPDVRNESLCLDEPHGAFDYVQGVWEGTSVSDGDGLTRSARLTAGKALDGCAIVIVLDNKGIKTLMTMAFVDNMNRWVNFRLDDQPGTRHKYYLSSDGTTGANFVEASSLVIEDEFTFFLSPEKVNALAPSNRMLWEKRSDNHIIVTQQSRASETSGWETTDRIELHKQS